VLLSDGKRRPESFHGLLQSSSTDIDVPNIKQSAAYTFAESRTEFWMTPRVAGGGDNRFKPWGEASRAWREGHLSSFVAGSQPLPRFCTVEITD
jgi:hypothetical protein